MLKAPLTVLHPHLTGRPEQRYLVDAQGIHIATGPEVPLRELATRFNSLTPDWVQPSLVNVREEVAPVEAPPKQDIVAPLQETIDSGAFF